MSKKLLVVNLHFSPSSFGGATIVAEQMAKCLSSDHDWAVSAFSTIQSYSLPEYALRRYRNLGIDVAIINLPAHIPYILSYANPMVRTRFTDVLDSFKPDIVHMHAIQNLGAEIVDAVRERDIPLAITMHDCWWICDRQFMLDSTGHYCFQTKLSAERCRYCVDDYKQSEAKIAYLAAQMNKADVLLYPSDFLRNLYVANGANADRSIVNKNGVAPPSGLRHRTSQNKRCVFGFVGGPGPMKGSDQICDAIRLLGDQNLQLRVVDAAQNVGQSWQNTDYWDIPAQVEHIPAYTYDTMDEFFNSIDVLLFPSQVKESFGLAVREALLRDVWVISTDAGGASEDIEHGVNGTIIPLDGSGSHLARAMMACMRRGEWNSYSNPCKSAITTVDDQARQLSGILTKLLSN